MSDLPTILKHNSTNHERAHEQAIRKGKPDLKAIAGLMNADTCPPHLLGWLAWAFSVDVWDEDWADHTKRRVIKRALLVHRVKGTLGAVRNALAAAGYGDAEVIERFGWDYHNGAASHDGSITHTVGDNWAEYRVKLARPITVEQADQVRAILRNVAPIRCHLKALDFTEVANTHNARITHNGQFTHGAS